MLQKQKGEQQNQLTQKQNVYTRETQKRKLRLKMEY